MDRRARHGRSPRRSPSAGTTVLAVGTSAEIRALAGKGTDVVDLRGRFVAPGFIDGHLHLLGGGLSLEELRLDDAVDVRRRSPQRVRDWATAHPDAHWVTGEGWTLRRVPGRPAVARCSSTRSCRTARRSSSPTTATPAGPTPPALRLAERHARDEGPAGRRDRAGRAGEPTGVLKESAMELVERLRAEAAAAREGAGAAHGRSPRPRPGASPSVHQAGIAEEELEMPRAARSRPSPRLRVYVALDMEREPDARGARAPGRAAPALRDGPRCASAR